MLSPYSLKYSPISNNFTQYSLHRCGLEPGAYTLFILWRSTKGTVSKSTYADAFAYMVPFILEERIDCVEEDVPLYAYPPGGNTGIIQGEAIAVPVPPRVFSHTDGTVTLAGCEGGVCNVFDISGRQLSSFNINSNLFSVEIETAGIYIFRTTDTNGTVRTDKVMVAR